MKNLLYLFLLLCIGLSACQKEDPQNQQRVIDSITKEPIANAKVELTIDESTDIFGGSSRRLIETVYTDEEGNYQFSESIDTRDGYYELFVFADRYFDITSGQGYSQNKLVELVPEGYLKLRVQKLDTAEYISGEISAGQFYVFSGYEVDTTFMDIQRAGNTGRIISFLTRNGDTELYIQEDSLFIPRHDTTHYKIVF